MPRDDPKEALRIIRKCLKEGDYVIDPVHCEPRMKQRGIDLADIKNAVAWCSGIEPYAEKRVGRGESAWRLHGPPLAETRRRKRARTIAIGVTIVGKEPESFVVVVTVF